MFLGELEHLKDRDRDERLKCYLVCLLWINKTRAKEKTYIWVSVRWKGNLHTSQTLKYLFIYYESTKRKLKTKYICGCRCYERLQTKTKEFTRLSYTELVLELYIEGRKKEKEERKKAKYCDLPDGAAGSPGGAWTTPTINIYSCILLILSS